jgi:CHAT domain-containing protein
MKPLSRFPVWLQRLPHLGGVALLTAFLVITLQPQMLQPQMPQSQRVLAAQSPIVASLSISAQALEQGRQRFGAGQFSEAAQLWQQAVQAYESQSDRPNHSLSLSYLSLAWQELGDWQQATQSIDSSLKLLNQLPAPPAALKAHVWNTQGKLLLAIGQPEKALEAWKTAEIAYRQSEDSLGTIGSQLNQTQALQALGFLRQAQVLLETVTQQLQQQPDSVLKLTGFRNLGSLWQVVGDLEKSEASLQTSLAIAQRLNQPSEVSATLFVLANTARAAGQTESALKLYAQALQLAPSPQQLQVRANQFSLLVSLQRWAEAKDLFRQIQQQLQPLAPSRSTIYASVNTASSAARNLQHFSTEAIAVQLATAAKQARSIQDQRSESYAIGELGRLYEQNQQFREAEQLTQQAFTIATAIDAPDIAYRWQWQLGRLHYQQGNRSRAIVDYQATMTLLKSLRADLVAVSPDVQFSFRESIEPIYRELVSLLIATEQPGQVELQQARETIEALQLAELEDFLRSACLQAQVTSIDKIDPKAAVIYPIILGNRLSVILSVPGQPLSIHSTAVAKEKVDSTLEQMLGSLNPIFPDQERLEISQQLYDWLIRPVEPALKQHQVTTLAFVLDGALRSVPMAALYDGKQYLVEQYSLAIAPGLQLLKPKGFDQPQQLQALIGGLAEPRQGFSSLPNVVRESKQIAGSLSAKVYLNERFTQRNLQESIQSRNYPLVHLATHGQFSSKLSDTFLLTWDDRLTIEGLRNLLRTRSEPRNQPIELLVLSACETAEGDQRATLGLAGMAVRSGARSTLATLWSVNDNSTADFMAAFYKSLTQENLGKAASVQQAQLKLLKSDQFSHPFYWAPFILVGNWL